MRILWVNESASFIGGCEQYIFQTAKLFRSRGIHSVFLYQSSKEADSKLLEVFEKAEQIGNLNDQLKTIPHDLIYIHQLNSDKMIEAFLESNAPVVRFFHDYHLFCLRRNKIIPFTNSPCDRVAGCRCYPLMCSLRPKESFPWIRLRTMWEMRNSQKINQQLDGYLVASEYVARQVIENGFDSNKLRAIPLYAPDYPREGVVRDPAFILFVGQLIRGKGVDVAIRAIERLGKPYMLKIAGEGKQKEKYQELAKNLGVDDRVEFLGKLSYEELASCYQKAVCVVFPTRYPELFGLVGIEAMSFGTPVVASNVGAVPEWLEDGQTGFLVPPNDPEKLAEKVLNICRDQKRALRMGAESRRIYEEKFLPEYHLTEIIDFFHELIETKKKKLSYGKFTVYGSRETEDKIRSLVDEVKFKIKQQIPPKLYRSILLIGGYGKGEGGVENGEPHNNLDFFIVSKGLFPHLREKIGKLISPISKKYGIGFDISEISEFKLNMSSHHLIWYEMAHGHKFLLGDRKFINSLPFAKAEFVLEKDFIELMANRGSLLIINRVLLDSHRPLDQNLCKVFIKHMMKAMIGFGDAYLFFHGHYHWSYKERMARISIHPTIPLELKERYCEAAEFRFRPNYENFLKKNFEEWLSSMEKMLSNIYMECERIHLKDPALDRTNYFDRTLEHAFENDWVTLGGLFRKLKGLTHPPRKCIGSTVAAKFSFWLLSPFERLSAIFSAIAFGIGDEALRQKIALYLNAESSSLMDLRKAYLNQWSIYGDVNFSRSIEEWELGV